MMFWFGVWVFLGLITLDFIASSTSKDKNKYDDEIEGSDIK